MNDSHGDADSGTVERRRCPNCERTTAHRTSIRIRSDSNRDDVRRENEKYARHPFVVYDCSDCGRSTVEKVS